MLQKIHSHDIKSIRNLNKEQFAKLKSAEEYLYKYQISDLFNELCAKTIEAQPEDIKKFLAEELKMIRSRQSSGRFFTTKDYEAIFEIYNILKLDYATLANLVQGLEALNILTTEDRLMKRYPDIVDPKQVPKKTFIEIMAKEYETKLDFSDRL